MKILAAHLAESVLRSLVDLAPGIGANEHLKIGLRGLEGLARRDLEGSALRELERRVIPRVVAVVAMGSEPRPVDEMELDEILLAFVTAAHPEVVVPRHLAVADVRVSL